MTNSRKIAFLIYNLPSLLTRKNLVRITTYIRLFGFKTTFNEVHKKLWKDNYFLYGGIKSIPPVKEIERLKDRSVPFEDTTVSVVIPVKNAGDDFQNLLSLIKNQKGFKDVEIIVVDSGSTDNSLQIAKEFGAKIIKTLPEEFSHSFSRNLGAKHASGDYLLFTVQDALPPSDLWLYELFSVIKDNDVVAVSCAEIPREDADLFYRAISWNHIDFLEIDRQDRIMSKPADENHFTLRKNSNLSNIACLIYRDIFMKYWFRGRYSEDLDLGLRLIRDGYKLALINSTRIIHSHNRPAYYYLKRGYVDNLWISQIFPDRPVLAPIEAEQLFRDIVFIYEMVNSIVYKDLMDVTVPCTMGRLSRIVTEKFRRSAKSSYPELINPAGDHYIDSKFGAFLEKVYKHKYSKEENNLPYDGILLDRMQSFTTMILEFMNNNYKIIDRELLEEFKYCLFKTYAFICGMQLASSFKKYSDSANQRYREIHDELTDYI